MLTDCDLRVVTLGPVRPAKRETFPVARALGFQPGRADITQGGTFFANGTGCYRWGDCLSCPFPECNFTAVDKDRYRRAKLWQAIERAPHCWVRIDG